MVTQIISLYKEGYNAYQIKDMLNSASVHSIYKVLHEKNLVRSRSACQISLQRQRDFFRIIDTEEKAYWLGFLYADGNVSSSKFYISIDLNKKDIKHLLRLQKTLNLTNKLHYNDKKNVVRLGFNDKQMHTDLIKQGCVPKKSLILEPPEKKYSHHDRFPPWSKARRSARAIGPPEEARREVRFHRLFRRAGTLSSPSRPGSRAQCTPPGKVSLCGQACCDRRDHRRGGGPQEGIRPRWPSQSDLSRSLGAA